MSSILDALKALWILFQEVGELLLTTVKWALRFLETDILFFQWLAYLFIAVTTWLVLRTIYRWWVSRR